MPFNPTTGVFTRVDNTFSEPVTGTLIEPADADELFDDYDDALTLSHTFTQTGTGATPIAITNIFQDKIFTPEMFGATTSSSDAGPGIQRAIEAAGTGGTVQLAPGTYTVITPIVDSHGVNLIGQSWVGSRIRFMPASNNQIAYRVRDAGNIVIGGSIRDVRFYAPDNTYTQTAIELEDVSQYLLENVYVIGGTVVPTVGSFWSGGAGSIGLRTRGREFIHVHNCAFVADRPIVVSDNPNSTIDIDVSDFDDLSLIANGFPGFQIEDGVNHSRLNISNTHVAHATSGFSSINTTSTLPQTGLTIHNFSTEQGTDPAGYNIAISYTAPAAAQSVEISGYQIWDNSNNGILLRNVTNISMEHVFYQGFSPLQCIDTDTTVKGLSWSNCNFQVGAITALTGQRKVWSTALASPGVLPRSAVYTSTADGGALTVGTSIAVQGSTSGLATFTPQAAQGTPSYSLPTGSGTLAVSATAPVTLNATTGAIGLATVNSNVGTFGDATHASQVTVNALGQVTAAANVLVTGTAPGGAAGGSLTGTYPNPALSSLVAAGSVGSATVAPVLSYNIEGRLTVISSATITPAIGSITGFGTGVATALAVNIGSAGAPVLFNGAGGTPSSITLTNGTGLPTAGLTGTLQAAQEPAHTGDVTNTAGSLAMTLATVNANVGTFGSATQASQVTVNAKGLVTAAANVTVTPAVGSITGLGTGVGTALAVNVGTAGAPVVNGGALGTPASGVATNLTGTAAGLTAGNVTTNANLTGDVTSVGNATTLTNAPVIAKVLTGYSASAGTVASTDSILQAFQKLGGLISNTIWTTYTPTVTAQAGTPTTVSATGRYKQIGKTVTAEMDVTITTVGTASGAVNVTLPVTAAAFRYAGIGFEYNATGKSGAGYIDGPGAPTYIQLLDSTAVTFWASGRSLAITVTYEVP